MHFTQLSPSQRELLRAPDGQRNVLTNFSETDVLLLPQGRGTFSAHKAKQQERDSGSADATKTRTKRDDVSRWCMIYIDSDREKQNSLQPVTHNMSEKKRKPRLRLLLTVLSYSFDLQHLISLSLFVTQDGRNRRPGNIKPSGVEASKHAWTPVNSGLKCLIMGFM